MDTIKLWRVRLGAIRIAAEDLAARYPLNTPWKYAEQLFVEYKDILKAAKTLLSDHLRYIPIRNRPNITLFIVEGSAINTGDLGQLIRDLKQLCSMLESLPAMSDPLEADLKRLVEGCSHFIRSQYGTSPWSLIPRVKRSKQIAPSDNDIDKCILLNDYYSSMCEFLGKEVPLSSDRLPIYLDQYNGVINSIDLCLKELLDLLSCEGPLDDSAKDDYRNLSSQYNYFLQQWEELLVKAGRTAIGYKTIPTLDEIALSPKKVAGEFIVPAGRAYEAYVFLSDLLASSKVEVFVAETYPDDDTFRLYLEKVPKGVVTRILIGIKNETFLAVASRFCSDRGVAMEIRHSTQLHDRVIFIDGRCWAVGHSLKDLGRKKPTYITEIDSYEPMKKEYDRIWNEAEDIKI
jgi:hypothetical protein